MTLFEKVKQETKTERSFEDFVKEECVLLARYESLLNGHFNVKDLESICAMKDCSIKEKCKKCWDLNYIENVDKCIDDTDINVGNISNNVQHPSHYQGKYECIEEMIELFGVDAVISFCKCNVYKYRFRATNKNGQEDIEKAENYMTILFDLEKRKRTENI